jgi:hypothetical protein
MKRIAACAALALLAACDEEARTAPEELTIVVQGDRRELEQQDKLLRERQEALEKEKAALEQHISDLAKGLKAAADAEQRRRIEEELRRQQALEGQMSMRASALQAQKTEVEAKKQLFDSGMERAERTALAAREASVAVREGKLSEREALLAASERELAGREKDTAAREKTLQAQTALRSEERERSTRLVPKTAALEARHKKLLEDIELRGILISDLPSDEQPINAEIFNARRQGDLARAWDLVGALTKAVAKLKVDQRFVEQKMLRLQGARGAARLSEQQRGEVERLLREVTGAYSDGHYEQANKGLNRIAVILDAGTVSG